MAYRNIWYSNITTQGVYKISILCGIVSILLSGYGRYGLVYSKVSNLHSRGYSQLKDSVQILTDLYSVQNSMLDSSWNVMAHGDTQGREVEVKLANAVRNQYPSHYLRTWCIQHYYRWCAHLGCQQSTELTPTGRFKWTRPFRTKDEMWFLRVCHHISTGLYINTSTIHVHFSRLQLKCDGTRWRREGKWRGNWRMQWVVSTLHTTSEHVVSSITTADAQNSAASSRLNWRPYWFKCSG